MPSESNPAVEEVITSLCARAPQDRTICPTDAARAFAEARREDELGWRSHLGEVRRAAVKLALEGKLVIYRKGKVVDPADFRGVYRLGAPSAAKATINSRMTGEATSQMKERDPRVKIAVADPMGAALYSYYTTGELKSAGSSVTEGIGQGRVTANLEGAPVDFAFQISDEEALPIIFDLVVEEGLLLGGSSGVNIAGAIRLARELGPGHTIVTILADSGARYASKLFNPAFLRSKNLPVPAWLDTQGRAPQVFV